MTSSLYALLNNNDVLNVYIKLLLLLPRRTKIQVVITLGPTVFIFNTDFNSFVTYKNGVKLLKSNSNKQDHNFCFIRYLVLTLKFVM